MSDTVAELKVIPKRKYSAKIVGYGAKPSAKGKQMMTIVNYLITHRSSMK